MLYLSRIVSEQLFKRYIQLSSSSFQLFHYSSDPSHYPFPPSLFQSHKKSPKMRSVYSLTPLAAAIGAVASQSSDSWVFGNSMFYLGPPSGNSRITKATYSIVSPSVPSGSKSDSGDEPWVSVWVGASSTAGDQDANLYQPIFNWCPDQESQYGIRIPYH